jgi:cell fate regulator YaaT (PSP1 superfamily)
MEEKKYPVSGQTIEDKEHRANPQAAAPAEQPAGNADVDDDAATAEEMEAFIRDRREKEKRSKIKDDDADEVDIFGEYMAPENSIDPYLEPDPTLPWVKYDESVFLSRGCKRCPECYVPVSETETRSCSKVTSCNWMRGIRQPGIKPFDCVEVRFKNNRKDFFRLPDGLEVTEGDVVAVEGSPGHDVGIVSLTGEVCRIQMKKRRVDPADESIRKLFRRAKSTDLERWVASLKNEHEALLKTRRIAQDLNLEMKVNDVEYQGDNAKAIFYYTADDRVDFRTLIKVLAEEFHVRIEMKQIGVRQEAGKVGGLGTCGRELCCSTWLTNFKSVTTSAAKTQQILPNPQKLAGQCGKLKCCLNFECEVYADALKKFPPANISIRFKKGLAMYKKTDVFRGIMWYAYENENDLYAIPAESVKQLIEMNRHQEYPERLEDYQVELMSTAALAQETNNAEFERELRRMADDMAESDTPPAKEQRGDNRRERGTDKKQNNRQRNGERSGKPRHNQNDPARSDTSPRPRSSQGGNRHPARRNLGKDRRD